MMPMVTMEDFCRRVYLRVLRWAIRIRNFSGLQKFAAAVIFCVLLAVPVWRHFGTDTALAVLADATPILLAVVGVVMSYIQPRKESHKATTIILFIACIGGTAVLTLNRLRTEAAHRSEVGILGQKMDFVRNQNSDFGQFLLKIKAPVQVGEAGRISEADRRKGIEVVLRNEYIMTHDPIDPEILAGNRMPPDSWMNMHLANLGEKWKVADVHTLARTFIEPAATQSVSAPAPDPRQQLLQEATDQQKQFCAFYEDWDTEERKTRMRVLVQDKSEPMDSKSAELYYWSSELALKKTPIYRREFAEKLNALQKRLRAENRVGNPDIDYLAPPTLDYRPAHAPPSYPPQPYIAIMDMQLMCEDFTTLVNAMRNKVELSARQQ